jgi:hypothetical protein
MVPEIHGLGKEGKGSNGGGVYAAGFCKVSRVNISIGPK